MTAILKTHLIAFARYFRDPAKTLVALAYFLVFGVVFLGTFGLSLGFLSYLNSFAEVSKILFSYTLSLSFLILLALSVFSFFISGVNLYFRDKALPIAFTTPTPPQNIFLAKFTETILVSTWPIFLLGLPLLLGYAKTIEAEGYFLFYFLSILFLFSVLSHSLASLLILTIANIFKQISSKISILFVFLGATVFAFLFVKLLLPPEFYELEKAQNLIDLEQRIRGLPALSPILPSTWVANFITGGDFASFFFLAFTAILFFLLVLRVGKKYFYPTWLSFQEGKFIAKSVSPLLRAVRAAPFPIGEGKFFALAEKELLRIFRNPIEIYSLAFIFFLSFLYTLVLSKAKLPTDPYLFSIATLFSFAALGFILTTFALRFIFPSFSLEGKGAWGLFSAPVSPKTLVLSKFFLFLFLVEAFALGQVLSLMILSPQFIFGKELVYLTAAVSLGIGAITFGLGASFPNFSTESAEKASTSFPGIAATLLCLTFVFYITLISPQKILLTTLGITAFFLTLSILRVRKYEF